MPHLLAAELESALGEWDDISFRPIFGWRGAFVGRRLVCCYRLEADCVRVWTKLPELRLSEALARPQARPHPLNFRRWLEIQLADEADLAEWLPELHRAYEWVRDGESD